MQYLRLRLFASRLGIARLLMTSVALMCLGHAGTSYAARKAVLWIKVLDMNTGKPVVGAEVTFKGTMIRVQTDKDGELGIELSGVKYGVTIHKEGYYESVLPNVELEPGKAKRITVDMVPGDPAQQLFFGLGGINVVGTKELLPEELTTTHQISSAEIEHNLSTNLGDVLTLVPGVERTEPPGLARKTQVAFRGSGFVGGVEEQTAAIFGAKVILDGITISNNTNLQVGTSYGPVKNTAGSGIDLRTIPADNIERVEVITGVPSAEYGDLTTGLVKVVTKKEKQPHRLKIKSNPDTKEGNLSGGWMPKNIGVSYNLNYAYSERDIRRADDNYSRYSGQFTARLNFLQNRAALSNRFYYTGVLDETNLNPDDPLSNEQYNRDKTYMYALTFDVKKSPRVNYFLSGSVRYTNRDSFAQRLTGADTRVLTDATDPGTNEGFFDAGGYIYQVWTKGEEWNGQARANLRLNFDMVGLGHKLLVGSEYTYDSNVGEGRVFDPFHPPGGSTGQRPLPFDASPAMNAANVYLEDEISGILFKTPWIANLGLRYEMYRPYKFNFSDLTGANSLVESRNGTFANPRLRLRVDFTQDTRVRVGWGRSSKMPSMTNIYRGPEYIDIIEENISPPDSTPLVTTYVYDFNHPNLRGYQIEKGEISLDKKIGSVATVLTGFFSDADYIPRAFYPPLVLHRYR